MSDDGKRAFIEMVGRLGRETQLHLDERYLHFQITNVVLLVVSLLLAILAIFNMYYIHILYKDMSGIVESMDSMHYRLRAVNDSMLSITDTVGEIDRNMEHMDRITQHTLQLSATMPEIRQSMHQIGEQVGLIDLDMVLMSSSMTNVELRFVQMTGGVGVMRENVYHLSRPMGFMNPMMP